MALRPTIAFDLDGTLVDTAPDLLDALNLVLDEAGLDAIPPQDMRRLVGGGARVLIERGLSLHGKQLPAGEVDRLFTRFLDHYDAHIADRSAPFPGAEDTLERLAGAGYRLVVVTNKPERYSMKLLSLLGLAPRFSVIAGPDTYGVRKPDPAHLLRAVAAAGGVADAAVMIGDSAVDVATARAARVPVIAVSYGYSDVNPSELGADRLVDRLAKLPSVVAEVFGAVRLHADTADADAARAR
jgi:phosphoglycolate phosphatase